MRTLLNAAAQDQIALEAQAVKAAREVIMAVSMLSLEEEAIEVCGQTMAAAEIKSDIAETNRAMELADALENLSAIGENIEAATPAETQLIEVAGDMAVAGSDISPEELVPAMEAFLGGKPDMSSIRAKAKQIWEAILGFVERIWTKITDFIHSIAGAVPRLRRSLLELEDKAKEIGDKKAEGIITITQGVSSLSVDHQPVKSEKDLEKALATLLTYTGFVFDDLAKVVVVRGKIVENAIKEFDPAKAELAAEILRSALLTTKEKVPGQSSTANKTIAPGYDTFLAASMLGNVSLAYKHFNENPDKSVLGSLDRLRYAGFDLVPSSEKPAANAETSFEMAPLSPKAIEGIIAQLLKVLDDIEKYERGGHARDIASQGKAIKAASAEASRKLAAFQVSSAPEERAAVEYYRAILNFNAAYVTWSADPATPMMSNTLRSVRAVMVVLAKSIAAHK